MRILFIAETASIHAARWINQFRDTGWAIHVFQGVAQSNGVSPEFKCGELYLPYPAKVPDNITYTLTLPSNRLIRNTINQSKLSETVHVRHLAKLIKMLNPDVIHSLGLNVNGNNMCRSILLARRILGEKFKVPWIYSSWGTDLDYYLKQSDQHRREVENVLQTCDYYIAECNRDALLAKKMGFHGEFAGFFPAFGGINCEEIRGLRQKGDISSREIVMLKGRDHAEGGDPIGRAMTAMKAFLLCRDILSGRKIVIGQATSAIKKEAALLSKTKGFDIEILPYVSHKDLLNIMGSSKVFIALTTNDGLPSSLVEAMSLGALPIHSDLDPIREWISNGENGLLVPPEDIQAVAFAIERAFKDDDLIEKAAKINSRIVKERLSYSLIRHKAIKMYEHVAGKGQIVQKNF